MNTSSHVPPGFRFYPTDEELVGYYLRKKVASKRIDLNVIRDIDLYKIEPWDLQECCRIGSEEQNEWHFFSHKDRKYPTGTRMNRATKTGFWKATGRDKPIYSKHNLIGMRKTLVYYIGRAPNGQKTDWIIHEYRLESNENGTTPQEEGWVVGKAFRKRVPMTTRKGSHDDEIESSNFLFDSENFSLMPNQENNYLQSPMLPNYINSGSEIPNIDMDRDAEGQLVTVDWRILDKFVASQLSHDHVVSQESQLLLPQNCNSEFSD